MSLKRLLGLQECPLSEQEILMRIEEAEKKDLRMIEFPLRNRKIRIVLKGVNQQGIMKDYESQYTT